MFNDDEDYSFLTGGLGDLDGEGRVDFVEYMNEEDDYQRIMHRDDDDDYSVLDDDEDIETLSEAEELGIDPNDYFDNDEFEAVLVEARENATWKEEREDEALSYNLDLDDFDTEEEFDEAIEDLENKAQNNEIDDSTFADDNVKAAMGAYAVAFASMKNKYGVSKSSQSNPSTSESTTSSRDSSFERRYYDREDRIYRIGDAIYDNFKEVSDNYEKHECEDFSSIIEKVYSVNNELGLKIWLWVLNNFKGALVNQGVDEYDSQAWSLTDCIFGNLHSIDNENNSDFIFEYASKHPELEEIIYHLSYIDDFNHTITNYIPYCIENDFRDNFVRVYNGFITNKFRNEKKLSKYSILEDLLSFCQINGLQEADGWYYSFFEKEINSLNKPLKRDYLIKLLNAENYGKRMFLKPNVDDVIEVYHEEPITKKSVETEFENKESLENTLKELKISLKNIIEEVKEINFKIKDIEAKINNI